MHFHLLDTVYARKVRVDLTSEKPIYLDTTYRLARWMWLDAVAVEQLPTFIAAVDEGSFSRLGPQAAPLPIRGEPDAGEPGTATPVKAFRLLLPLPTAH